jgi:hypothetical protein
MMGKSLAIAVAFLALGANAQTSVGSMDAQRGASSSSTMAPAPAYRSMPSRPSAPSGPTVSGDMATPGSPGVPDPAGSARDSSTVGGSGSAGLAAMGGGTDAGSSATNQMGAGLMTDCPIGTTRKMGLCVPYGQARKKSQP